MRFINSYKKLEKLCNEIYNSNRGISDYIDDMSECAFTSHYVPGWDDDLEQLKHYRWIRNKIVHEPDCTEENLCENGDAEWLDNFYSRIMSVNDPLALYRKMQNVQKTQKPEQYKASELKQYKASEFTHPGDKHSTAKPIGWSGCLVGILLIVVLAALVIIILYSIFGDAIWRL